MQADELTCFVTSSIMFGLSGAWQKPRGSYYRPIVYQQRWSSTTNDGRQRLLQISAFESI